MKDSEKKKPGKPENPPKPAPPDEDDEGGAYTIKEADQTLSLEELGKKTKKDDRPKVKRKLKKKQIQYAEEWQKVKITMILAFCAVCCFEIIWILQFVNVGLSFFGDHNYSLLMEELKPRQKPPQQFRPGEFEEFDKMQLVVGLGVGRENRELGKNLMLVISILSLCASLLLLAGCGVAIGAPHRFGSRGQIIALLSLGVFNLLVNLFFRLLPLTGALGYVLVPYVVPDVPLSHGNVERQIPIHVFWCDAPLWEILGGLVLHFSGFTELLLLCIFLWTTHMSIQEDELQASCRTLMLLAVGQSFMFLAYFMLSITGTSYVLVTILWVTNMLWRGFMLWLLIWLGMMCLRTKNALAKTVEEEEED